MRRRFRNPENDLDALLLDAAPTPERTFAEEAVHRIHARTRRPGLYRSARASFAAAVLVLVAGTFASFGGVGYAAGGVGNAAEAVSDALVTQKQAASVVRDSAAQAQYPREQPVDEPEPSVQSAAPSPLDDTTVRDGGLPFTGLGLAMTVAAGLLLLALGLLLRRAAYARADSRDSS